MKVLKPLIPVIVLFFVLVGCSNSNSESNTTSNPTPQDFLKYDDADIFLFEGYVYSNSQDVKWVEELDYSLGKQIGKITKQTDKASNFKNGTANKLPVGTKIYDTDTPVYIAIVNKKEIPYLKMVEG